MKRIDEWKGLVYIRGEQTNIHIQIFKPKKINYYIHIDTIKHSILSRIKDVPFKEVFGPLISVVKKRIKGNKMLTFSNKPYYSFTLRYSATASHQGGKTGSFQKTLTITSANDDVVTSLTNFLFKYIKKSTDKTKKSTDKTKKSTVKTNKSTGKTKKSTGKTKNLLKIINLFINDESKVITESKIMILMKHLQKKNDTITFIFYMTK